MEDVKKIVEGYRRIQKLANEMLGPITKVPKKQAVRAVGYREVGLARFKLYNVR